jgi:hypothetical protein
MPDISEIWSHLGFVLAPAAGIFLVILCGRLKKKWMRYTGLTLAVSLSLIAILALLADCYFTLESTARIPNIVSPDGKHVAIVNWTLMGAVGFDHVHISIRPSYWPFAKEVESGFAEQPPRNPAVRWLDNQHLLIVYYDKGKIEPCNLSSEAIDGIEVLCQQ